MSRTVAKITIGALIGGAIGLLVGLALASMSVVDNPFWLLGIGIAVGAGASTIFLFRNSGESD